MRIGLLTSLLLAASVALPSTAISQESDNRPGIAVFPFTNGGSYGPESEDLAPLEVGIQQMLLTELAQNPALRIVERSTLRGIIEEQELGASGRVDTRTAADVGKLVGARYVVTGVFTDLFGNFRLDGRVIDVETGEILNTEQVRAEREEMYDLLVELASKITAGVDLPPLPAATTEARKSREIPAEAVTLYSRAQVYQDGGRTEQAIELYRRINQEFPEMTEAREALLQLTGPPA
ncbi:MAG TPA: CsgG/HfaB family protein [Longimicrobiaceae bacterium]|nr:CsgG/HfaB family protein [Longimicrobiaceae bacterium]